MEHHHWTIASPDGRLTLDLFLTDHGQVLFSSAYAGEPILQDSRFAVDVRPGGLLADGLKLVAQRTDSRNETYRILAGKADHGVDQCNEITLTLQEHQASARKIELTFRVFDDGVAMRYSLDNGGCDLVAERTEFRFPSDLPCWVMELPHFLSSFESEFHARKLSQLFPGQLISCPVTLQTPSGLGIAITEANLKDFAGMYLEAAPGERTTLISRLAPRMDGSYSCVKSPGRLVSPWRMIQVRADSRKADRVEHPLLPERPLRDPGHKLDPWRPRDLGLVERPRPSGKVQTPGMNNETMMDFIDFAAEMKLEYMLIDGGWYHGPQHTPLKSRPEIDLPMLVKYANSKGVDVLVWLHQKDVQNCLDEALAWYESLNVKGVKVDFFDRDDQDLGELGAGRSSKQPQDTTSASIYMASTSPLVSNEPGQT